MPKHMSSIEEVVINDLNVLLDMAKNCPHNGKKCPLLHRLHVIKRALEIVKEKSKDENDS